MTGKPCFELKLRNGDQDKVWSNLLEIHKKNYAAVCGCYRSYNQKADDFKKVGLIQPHAYSVLRLIEISGNRLLKLKNP